MEDGIGAGPACGSQTATSPASPSAPGEWRSLWLHGGEDGRTRQRNRLCGTPEPTDQASQEAAAQGWEAEAWLVPTVCPQREQVSRWRASWGLACPDPLLLGRGDQARHLWASVSASVTRDAVSLLPSPLRERGAGRVVTSLPMLGAGNLSRPSADLPGVQLQGGCSGPGRPAPGTGAPRLGRRAGPHLGGELGARLARIVRPLELS